MTFDNEHMLRDFARLLREARPIPAHTAVTVLDEAAAELADLRAENARLNAMRQHCERCGGDYLATGVETGCPCALRARVAEATVQLARRMWLIENGERVFGTLWREATQTDIDVAMGRPSASAGAVHDAG